MELRVIFNNKAEILDRPENTEVGVEENFSFLKSKGKIITITPVMREILEFIRAPRTPYEIVKLLSKKQNCSFERISSTVCVFLNRMLKFGALVIEGNEVDEEVDCDITSQLEQTMKFGEFTLLERIGKNHKAALYRCRRGDDHQNLYTLKVLQKKKSKSFTVEYEILNALPAHDNIRKIIEHSVVGDIPYLLLEYVEGKPLSDIASEVSLGSKYRIAFQMMAAIAHLHAYKILHGDIHCSNFLVDNNNHVHLIDLGMAYHEHDEKVRHGGIPKFMAPERMSDDNFEFSKQKGDYRSEVFQLGICLYYLFSGEYPFKGRLLKELIHSIKYTCPLPLTKTCYEEPVPTVVEAVIFKSLEKDPLNRYQSVDEMLHDWANATIEYDSISMNVNE